MVLRSFGRNTRHTEKADADPPERVSTDKRPYVYEPPSLRFKLTPTRDFVVWRRLNSAWRQNLQARAQGASIRTQ